MTLKKKTLIHAKTFVAASLFIAGLTVPLLADRINAGPVWEVGLGVEHVSVTATGSKPNESSGWGGQPVFVRGSLIGTWIRSATDGAWMVGDYLALGIGGFYSDQGYVRLPLDLGVQGGAVVAGEFQVVARAGIMGVGTQGGTSAGGFGTYFYSLRGKWQNLALEGGFGLRKDAEENASAGMQFVTGRWYFSDVNLGVRFITASWANNLPTKDEVTDRSILVFMSLEI